MDLEVGQLKLGLHSTHTYGTVYLLQEHKRRKQCSIADADGKMIPMDGYVICNEATSKAWFATRCWGWSRLRISGILHPGAGKDGPALCWGQT